MVARDDSVIRGSLIASLIFLVLSIALNFFLWRWGDTQASEASNARDRLTSVQSELRTKEDQTTLMKAVLGVGVADMSPAEFDQLVQSTSDDSQVQEVLEQFTEDMTRFGPEFDPETVDPNSYNYDKLSGMLVEVIKDRNAALNEAREDVTTVRSQRDSDVAIARKAQQVAEQNLEAANKELQEAQAQFTQDREQMNLTMEKTKDSLNQTVNDLQDFRARARNETESLNQRNQQLASTIEMQRQQLNRLRSDRFETTQGEIRYVMPGGNVATINLGSADALRPGVTFGVVDGDATRLQDADVKATVQVTDIRGAHLAEVRVVGRPEIRNPIIPGDKIYSPFWAPGREVKIALTSNIDIDGDDRPDTQALQSMIEAAGAEVAAVVSADGSGIDQLDSSMRFLVVGETPDLGENANGEEAQIVRALGQAKAKAAELGVTVIPAWKLQAYLKTIDDSLTTPLGSAARGEDFPPERSGGTHRRPSDLPELYKRQSEGMQRNNEILQP